jgi:hypothetical protein
MSDYVVTGYVEAAYIGDSDTYGGIKFDGVNKRIILSTASVTAAEIWSRWCDWHKFNSKWPLAFRQAGGDDLGGGLFIPAYFFLSNGWRVRPMESSHNLTITGNLFVEGGGVPVVSTIGVYQVNVNYTVPVQAQGIATSGSTGPTAADVALEVWNYINRTLTTSASGATAAEIRTELAPELAQITKVSKIHGVGVPLVYSPTSRVAGDLVQTFTTVGDTTTVSAA